MPDKRIVPAFNSEAEEAQWWFDNRETFARDLKQALADGTAGVGTVGRRMHQRQLRIDLDPADAALAQTLAARKGVPWQSFVRTLLHEELERANADPVEEMASKVQAQSISMSR